MRLTICVLPVLLAASSVLAAPAPAEKEKADQDKLQGDWVVISAKTDDPSGGQSFKDSIFRVTGEKLDFIKPSGVVEDTATFKLDPKKKPKEIDIEVAKKDGRKRTVLGVYAFDGGKLQLCWSAKEGGARPTGFDKSGGKDELRVYVLERKKDKKE